MTPGARASAAIAVLDRIAAGEAAERALTNWARASRYAGSGDRAAVRDLVFDALRRWRSSAALGGGETGRARLIGLLRGQGADPADLFTGAGHAPPPLTPAEAAPPRPLGPLEALDCPDWLAPPLQASLGADFAPVMAALRDRAPVFLRVNAARIGRDDAAGRLAAEGILAVPDPLSPWALRVTGGARAIAASAAYAAGLVELQDGASQAVVAALGPAPGLAVLDFCAGGGGKALALAACGADVTAHDAAPGRMRDLPARAARAGAAIATAPPFRPGGWPLVLADAPCSGSGAWRRQPEARWRLTPAALAALTAAQDGVLDAAAGHVAPGGRLAYATCSMLGVENADRIAAFTARHPGWRIANTRRWTPLDGGDGFYLAVLAAPGG
ncbi:MAG: RsmB/NOP family class I SAM-dependent RNA methyltransferase [Gemmobacter sp.]